MPTKSTKSLKPKKATKEHVSAASALDATVLSPTELHSLISQRAYEIYLQRGAGWGNELNDWLLAEQEITAATQAPIQILIAEPDPITSKTRRATARPLAVKAPAKRSSTTTHALKKPAPEI
jgi:hypothetical protein